MHPINIVTVIGANGTMGCNVSAIFAAFGGAKVYMAGRSMDKVKKAVQRAVKSVRADSIASRLIPVDYDMLENCIRESDLIFESVSEDYDVKLPVMTRIGAAANDHAIVATGSSGLSITSLAEALPARLRSRFFGVHMFNPPYQLTLCELIAPQGADPELREDLSVYLRETLRRTVVPVRDEPAFLGNRIGFHFINRALQCAQRCRHSGGIDYVDAILGSFTGRSMAPLVTSDFVGLDVHKAIVDNIYDHAPDYAREAFCLPEYVQALIDEGKLGRKAGGGLYRQEMLDNGMKRMTVYDLSSHTYRSKYAYRFPFAEEMKEAFHTGNYRRAFATLINNQSAEACICLEFLLEYIIYSLFCAQEVGYSVHAADDVMATGFNWCPPLAMADALDTVTDLKTLIHERLDGELLAQAHVDELLLCREPSRYDYRPYFKSM